MAKVTEFNSNIIEYAFLSNFFPSPFVAPLKIKGKKRYILFQTAEHYYQAHKTKDPRELALIINANGGSQARYFGSAKSGCNIIEDFDSKRKKIMQKVARYKYAQNPLLAEMLIRTKGKLVELAPWDDYFGSGRDGDGKNVHGRILTALRKELKEDPDSIKKYLIMPDDLFFLPKLKAEDVHKKSKK
jgi:ribA/ribD-fused uncharacterized protein